MDAVLSIPRAAAQPQVDFSGLYEQTVDTAWRVLSRLGVPAADLEDAVQDVFVIAHRRLETLRPDVRPTAWVAGIAVRVAHDHRRRVARKPTQSLEPLSGTLQDLRARPDDVAVQSQAAELLQRVLDRLDPQQREVFVLAELEQWSAPEIARVTDAPLNTVYSRLRLARAAVNALVARLQEAAP